MENLRKECFGVLDNVFPIGKQGLREVSGKCLDCPDRVPCLREALDTEEGLEFRSEIIDRAPSGGFMDRLRRWSRKKDLSRRLEQRRGTRK